jgi:uncharacterized protein YlxW (UPF0749 family)
MARLLLSPQMITQIFLAIAILIIIALMAAFTILVKQVRKEGRMSDLVRTDLMRDIRDIKLQTYSTNANVRELRNELSGYLNSARNPYLDSSHPSSLNNSRDRRRERRAAKRRSQQTQG